MRVGQFIAALGLGLALAATFVSPSTAFAQETTAPKEPASAGDAKKDAKQAELDKKFSELLTGAELIGTFTVDGKTDKAPKEDRYTLVSVSKLDGDMWLFSAKMKNVVVPMPLQVKWAGDTPVITMTETTIPGMGTFTCRVLFYEDHYIGYWRHGEVRGGMSGRIEKSVPEAEKPQEEKIEKPAATPKSTAPKAE